MQRAALCLVAVLAVLAGCTGALGGSDATPTEVSTATATPTNESLGPSTIQIVSTSLDGETVRRGDTVPVTVTVRNTGGTEGFQTVEYRSDGERLGRAGVRLDAGETTTVSLGRLENTSAYSLGNHTFSFRTANDTASARLHVDYESSTHAFVAAVDEETIALENGTVISEDRVKLAFQANYYEAKNYTDAYRQGRAEPVPEAAAYALANRSTAPEVVTLAVIHNWHVKWRANLTKSLATRYVSGNISAVEFRTELRQRGSGRRDDVPLTGMRETFMFPHGDRARRAYAEGLAKRLRNTEDIDVGLLDYGPYNTTYSIPSTNKRVHPNSSIFVKIEVDPTTQHDWNQIEYRDFNTTKEGARAGLVIMYMARLMGNYTYGEIPESINLRYVNKTSEELYMIDRYPTHFVQGENTWRQGVSLTVQIGLSKLGGIEV